MGSVRGAALLRSYMQRRVETELGVGPNKVVPERVESLERGLAAEAAVGSAVIVEVEPGGEGALSLC